MSKRKVNTTTSATCICISQISLKNIPFEVKARAEPSLCVSLHFIVLPLSFLVVCNNSDLLKLALLSGKKTDAFLRFFYFKFCSFSR